MSEDDRVKFIDDYRKKYKTEMCKNWELKGRCKFGSKCCFAHGRDELQEKRHLHQRFKTKPCKQYFREGYCAYGLRCQYIHTVPGCPDLFRQNDSNYQVQTPQRARYNYELIKHVNDCALDPDAPIDLILNKLPHRYFYQIKLRLN